VGKIFFWGGMDPECVGTRSPIVQKGCLDSIALVKYYVSDTCLCIISAKLEASFIAWYTVILLYMIYCYIVYVLYVSTC
jgi:hypothetical protein